MTRSFSTCQSPNLCCARGASCHRKLSSQVVVAIRVVSTGQSKMLIDARAPSSWASQLGHSSASWVDSPVVSNTDTSCWVSSPAPRYSALDPFTSLEDRRHDQTVTRTRRRRRGSPPHMVLMGDVAVSSTSMQIGGNIGDSSIGSDIAAQWQPLWHEFAPRRHQTEDLLTRAVGYDVGAMDSFFAVRPERAWVRCAQVVVEVCGVLLALAADELVTAVTAGGRNDGTNRRAPEHIRRAVTRLGPNFVKIGQALASRPDLVGDAIAGELLLLQDAMPTFPHSTAKDFIREELGSYPEDIFENMGEVPVAAASLGQVYKASVAGRAVAVKVQRPDLLEAVGLDFYLARAVAKTVTRLSRGPMSFGGRFALRSDLVAAVDEYGSRLFEELDYRIEAQNMLLFQELYGSMPGVVVPDVLLDYSGRRVITTEWVDGEKLVDAQAQVNPADMPILRVGIECTLTQLLDKGFLHADPHGGNLLKTPDKRLAYLDFGLVSTIPPTVMDALICATVQVMNRDYVSLAKGFPALALMSEDDLVRDFAPFAVALEAALDPIVASFRRQLGLDGGGGDEMRRIAFAQLIDRIFLLARSFNFKVPPYFISNVRALGELEGLAMTADPGFSLITVVYPYICRRLLSDPSPSLLAALQEIAVSEDGSMRWEMLEALVKDANILDQRYGPDERRPPLDLSLEFLLSSDGKFFRNAAASDLKRAALSSLSRKIPVFSRFRRKSSPSPRGNSIPLLQSGGGGSSAAILAEVDKMASELNQQGGGSDPHPSGSGEGFLGANVKTPATLDAEVGGAKSKHDVSEEDCTRRLEAEGREAARRELSRRLMLGARRRPALAFRVGAAVTAAAVRAAGGAIVRGFRSAIARPWRRKKASR